MRDDWLLERLKHFSIKTSAFVSGSSATGANWSSLSRGQKTNQITKDSQIDYDGRVLRRLN